MAYTVPKPHKRGEEWLVTVLKSYRDLRKIMQDIDSECPGMRAIVTRFAAFIGPESPLPPDHPANKPLTSTAPGRRRQVTTLLQASLLEACKRYENCVRDGVPTIERRDAFLSGLLTPVFWCFMNKLVPCLVESKTGALDWSIAELTPYVDTNEKAGSRNSKGQWKMATVSPLNPEEAIVNVIRWCVEPEYEHWISPAADAVLAV